jgi:hypothetical protein
MTMRISQLIAQLQQLQRDHGDMIVNVATPTSMHSEVSAVAETIEGDPDPTGLRLFCVIFGD